MPCILSVMQRWAALLMAAGCLHAEPRCLPCHSQQVSGYARSGMGRSITKPTAEPATSHQFRHTKSGAIFIAEWRSGSLVHRIQRRGEESAHTALWSIGSGNTGKSYVIRISDALFQSPISWYSAKRAWDLSPGFEHDDDPGFSRPITSDCLFCHAGAARPRDGTLNRYLDPPFEPASIGCDRCHGDPALHVKTASKKDIVNPARLERDRRDAVCEQCHLSGEARIPNAGRTFLDFRPGMRLEEVFSVYVNDVAGDPKGLKVVSHAEQLAQSRCFRESSRRMWCGTCHDPHMMPTDTAAWYRAKCMQCHEGPKMTAHQNKTGVDCAGCHMPKSPAYDGGHTAFHDHWIRLDSQQEPGSSTGRLRAWREPVPASRQRNLGLAYISAGSRNNDKRQLVRGFQLLTPAHSDGAAQTARGLVLLQSGRTAEALAAFRLALAEAPNDSTRHLNFAAAQLAANNRVEAANSAKRAIELEPLLESAYALLAETEPARADYWKDRYRKLVREQMQ